MRVRRIPHRRCGYPTEDQPGSAYRLTPTSPRPDRGRSRGRPAARRARPGSRLCLQRVDSVVIGDLLLVRSEERVAVDGEVTSRTESIDQAAITGERASRQQQGDTVYAGTLNQVSAIEVCRQGWSDPQDAGGGPGARCTAA